MAFSFLLRLVVVKATSQLPHNHTEGEVGKTKPSDFDQNETGFSFLM